MHSDVLLIRITSGSLWITVLGVLITACIQVNGQTCISGNAVGPDIIDRPNDVTAVQDEQFLAIDQDIGCHGTVRAWTFYYNGLDCHPMTFQIWRPTTGGYILVGQNVKDDSICSQGIEGVVNVLLMVADYIQVQPGDVYGWRDDQTIPTVTRVIPYNEALSGSGQYGQVLILEKSAASCSGTPGQTCPWVPVQAGGEAKVTVRDYSLIAVVQEGVPPYFSNLPATAPLYENEAAGTLVYKVEGFNSFSATTAVPPDLVYTLKTATPPATACDITDFAIDAGTGEITTTGPLDHETAPSTCVLEIQVIEDPATPLLETLTVEILDVNEPHDLTGLPATVVLDAAIDNTGFTVIDLDFSDLDDSGSVLGGPITFHMQYSTPPNAPVTLNANTGKITVSQDLEDWLSPLYFTVGYVAADSDFYSGPKELTILITNIRQPPILTNLEATVTVPEDVLGIPNDVIYDVDGQEVPSDSRGTPLDFAIAEVFPRTAAADLFTIDTNGEVSHIAKPGFDYFGVTNVYDVEIEVRNNDLLFTSDPKNLTVEITWVNEPPLFTTWTYAATINESEPIGTALPGVSLASCDRDTPVGDWIVYSIYLDGSAFFVADNTTNKVLVDFIITLSPGEYTRIYNMNVTVVDSFGELSVEDATLKVTVVDINDHSPVFNPTTYAGAVTEDKQGPAPTGVTVSATDEDGGINAEITYSILEPEADLYFQVDSSGVVTGKQPIDYAIYKNFTFTVVAKDGGTPSLNDTATVFIEVMEVNAHAPYFDPDFQSIDLRSDTSMNMVATTVLAHDADSDAVNKVTYYYLVIQSDFGLDGNSGDVTVAKYLVAYKKYLLYISARDFGTPEYFSDPMSLRIDTYYPSRHLVDISMRIPLAEFEQSQDRFLAQLNVLLAPWTVRMESSRSDGDSSVATIYAIRSDLPDQKENQALDKDFIDKNDLMERLRVNMYGTPNDELLGPDFAEWQPYKVEPRYPNWILETPGGIAFLSILCILLAAGIVTLFTLLARRYGWGCFKGKTAPAKRTPSRPPPSGDDEFKLRYDTKTDKAKGAAFVAAGPVVVPSGPKGATPGGNPLVTYPNTHPAPPPKPPVPPPPPPPPKPSSGMRASMAETDPDRSPGLPAVQVPEAPTFTSPSRPLPYGYGAA